MKYLNIIDNITNFIIDNTRNLLSTIFVIFVTVLLVIIAKVIVKRFIARNNGKRKHAITLAKMLLSIIKFVVYALGVIIILGVWGIDVTPILAGAGIVALAVSLGAQQLINDLISGFCIVFENLFDVDDVVEIDGFKGRVEEISLRSTKIINWKNDVKIINNGSINTVINYSKAPSIGTIEVGVAYKENIDHVIKVLEDNLGVIREQFPQVIEGPNVLGVSNLGDSSVSIRIDVKTNAEEQYSVERGLKKFVKELFDREGIEIPFNQVVIHNAKSDN